MPPIYRCLILVSLSFSLSSGHESTTQNARTGKVTFQRECPCKNKQSDTESKSDSDEPKGNPMTVDGELDQLLKSHLNLLLPNNVYPVYMYQQVPSSTFPGCIMVPVMMYPSMSISTPSLMDTTSSANIDSSMYQSLSEMEKIATHQFYMDILHKYTKFYTSQGLFTGSRNSANPATNGSNGEKTGGQNDSQNNYTNNDRSNGSNEINSNGDRNGNNYSNEDSSGYNNNDVNEMNNNNNNGNEINNNNMNNNQNIYSNGPNAMDGKSNNGRDGSYINNGGGNYMSNGGSNYMNKSDTSTNNNDRRNNNYKEGIIFNN